ncbi:divergent polysaccharide deacetylase family protein [Paenibacillus sp. MMS18-CY102]|uniref:divergent polysaccharide deacetylase family protein n=1 Tax=Paenibacillus sp. MMS18-CY102 TaxID=2682849 RepID=UPI00136577A8|nr:divergent polysaccharide deacetylase family protein [Paenibacillus sp. MMS18-CY102]MWC29316.1 divergent polysaccharide deacetylase family protein [Paenibacillus sp. MMS18-CY102]
MHSQQPQHRSTRLKFGRWRNKLACLFVAMLLAGNTVPATMASASAGTDGRAAETKRVAIVIDDFGNGMTGTAEMMKLPFPFTVAVMPFMPTTRADAETAHKLGHDVIVHMPMEPNKGKREWLGPGALTTDLSDSEIRKRVEAAIDNVPFAVGMNNHMGSKVTADERAMRIVLAVCKERGLFFLDSRTTFKTVVPKVANELGVPLLSNHVFLDDVYSVQHIAKQIGVLRKYLEEHENCVAIGHVGPPGKKTAAVLLQSTPVLRENAVIVKLSDLVQRTDEHHILP